MALKISLESIYKILKKYYMWLMICGAIFIIAVNAWIFVQKVLITSSKELEISDLKIEIKKDNLNKMLENINIREENLLRVSKGQYPDLFSP